MNYLGVSQIIPLTSDSDYTLQGSIRTRNISTDQKPYLEISGYSCKAKRFQTKMVLDNQEGQEFSLPFRTPKECNAMILRLRRNKSNNLDNLLSGDFWMKNITVNRIDRTFRNLSDN